MRVSPWERRWCWFCPRTVGAFFLEVVGGYTPTRFIVRIHARLRHGKKFLGRRRRPNESRQRKKDEAVQRAKVGAGQHHPDRGRRLGPGQDPAASRIPPPWRGSGGG